MKQIHLFLILLGLSVTGSLCAQTLPSVSPTMTISAAEGDHDETVFEGSAPISITFKANPSDLGSYTPYYEWRFYAAGKESSPQILRYEENTSYVFNASGQLYIKLYVTFVNGTDSIQYAMDEPFQVTVSESSLQMPNAFTPNGDGINDVYKAKEGWKSIISFHAAIFNRWGKKIYEWSDPNGGWDGKDGGSEVPVGAYYCVVKAKGADGRNYNIRKTVSLLRDYNSTSSGTTSGN